MYLEELDLPKLADYAERFGPATKRALEQRLAEVAARKA